MFHFLFAELTKKTRTCLEFQALASLLRIDPPVTKIRRDGNELAKARKNKTKSKQPTDERVSRSFVTLEEC